MMYVDFNIIDIYYSLHVDARTTVRIGLFIRYHMISAKLFGGFTDFAYLCGCKMDREQRTYLIRKLKDGNHLWSYDLSKMDDISDEALIEHVLLFLDIDDIDRLFSIFSYSQVKRVWLDRVAPQGEMFHSLNVLYAWFYFKAKRPEAYVKSIETRHLKKLMR